MTSNESESESEYEYEDTDDESYVDTFAYALNEFEDLPDEVKETCYNKFAVNEQFLDIEFKNPPKTDYFNDARIEPYGIHPWNGLRGEYRSFIHPCWMFIITEILFYK
jgi:hypothetical protein